MCITRQQWLDMDTKNYVALGRYLEKYKEDVTAESKESEVCGINYEDGQLDSVVLLGGRICGCPRNMYYKRYYDSDNGKYVYKCCSFPETFDKNNLKFELSYVNNEEEITQYEFVQY